MGACRAYQIGLGSGPGHAAHGAAVEDSAGRGLDRDGHGPWHRDARVGVAADALSPPHKRNFLFSLQQTGVPFGGILAALARARDRRDRRVAVGARADGAPAGRHGRDDAARPPGLGHGPRSASAAVSVESVRRHHDGMARPPLRMLALAGGAFCWGQFVVISYTVVAAVTELGMSLIVAGTLLTAVQLGSIGGRVVAGWLADRVGGTRVLIWIGWLLLVIAAVMFWMGPGLAGYTAVRAVRAARRGNGRVGRPDARRERAARAARADAAPRRAAP